MNHYTSWSQEPSGANGCISVVGLLSYDLLLDLVRRHLGDDLSALLRTGVSTTMRHVSIPCFLSKDLPFRLEPVMKGPAF
jgi:hypothetical protein